MFNLYKWPCLVGSIGKRRRTIKSVNRPDDSIVPWLVSDIHRGLDKKRTADIP
jgi:hypothetical protein